jgi:hypothetical protein
MPGLILRSVAKQRVSKDEAAPSFETRSFGPLLRMRSPVSPHSEETTEALAEAAVSKDEGVHSATH